MSKVANYLNEHILGEVTCNEAVRAAMSTDASVLTIKPEMIVYPRTTNDIRKVARFSNQLAEKGHVLPITPRGAGSDQTGAAIGKGIILNTTAHMDAIFEIDVKQRLARVQPGVTFKALNDALRLHGMYIPSYPASASYSTIGGAIANNASGILSGKYGATGDWVSQIEIVLSSGDVLQTGRLSKRELGRKKGQQTLEGEIYRQIDHLITDNTEYLGSAIDPTVRDNAGYPGIATAKQKNGSLDLTPLIVGSQGTLGIISEVIVKAEFLSGLSMVAIAFTDWNTARDSFDAIASLGPCMMELLDGGLFETALAQGKKYEFYTEASESGSVAAVVLVGFDNPNERQRNKRIKKVRKLLAPTESYLSITKTNVDTATLLTLRDVTTALVVPNQGTELTPPLVDGVYIPSGRFEDFMAALGELAEKQHVVLPIYGNVLDNIYKVRPVFQLRKVTERQKLLKFTDEYAKLVTSHGGHLIGESGEGRFKAIFAHKVFDEDLVAIYNTVRSTFDPQGIMNPGVKQSTDVKTLVSQLRKSYELPALAGYSPTS
ncbi:MAG: FAD-binding oxidoreductase [Candidatus Saccharimonadales bacterium]